MKLDPTVKAAWLAALRDPNAIQAQRELLCKEADSEFFDGMCCLGKLCEVYSNSPDKEEGAGFDNNGAFWVGGVSYESFAPPEVADWAFKQKTNSSSDQDSPSSSEFDTKEFAVMYNDALTPLWKLNDDHGLTFAQIADLIEEQL